MHILRYFRPYQKFVEFLHLFLFLIKGAMIVFWFAFTFLKSSFCLNFVFDFLHFSTSLFIFLHSRSDIICPFGNVFYTNILQFSCGPHLSMRESILENFNILALSPFDNAVFIFLHFTFIVGSPFDPSGNLFFLI